MNRWICALPFNFFFVFLSPAGFRHYVEHKHSGPKLDFPSFTAFARYYLDFRNALFIQVINEVGAKKGINSSIIQQFVKNIMLNL